MSDPGLSAAEEATSENVELSAIKLTRHSNLVMIKDTPKGRGIFTTALIPARTTVEISPVLILSPEENLQHISQTRLWYYTYNWSTENGRNQTQALPLGLGSLFNHASTHSRRHNTGFIRNPADETIAYITLRDVEAGEELCICYGEDERLGFKDSDSLGYQNRESAQQDIHADPETDVQNIDSSLFSTEKEA